jgi:hypothetical protein
LPRKTDAHWRVVKNRQLAFAFFKNKLRHFNTKNFVTIADRGNFAAELISEFNLITLGIMFTKSDIEKMMADNEGKTFLVKTSNATGHGLNGVSYDAFFSYQMTDRNSGCNDTEYTINRASVKDVTDSMLVLDIVVNTYEVNDYNKVKRQHNNRSSYSVKYLPLDSIVSIEFIEPNSDFFGWMRNTKAFIDPENK